MNSSVIQSHLYNVFLTGQTSDISIRITGAFNATYKLHRVVLIQAGFWRDLFTGGFIESSGRRHTGINSDAKIAITSSGEEILDVILNDRNISRAAFELSISRLYGGGPPLYIHPSLVPTSTHPLTFGFPYTSALPLSSSILYPPGYQPATPAFLLSLLATSIYFSIPSLASEALTGILRTIGPRTIGYYLSFALGRAKLERADLSAVGLDGLAKDLEERKHEPETSGMVTSATHSAEIHSGEMHHEQYSPLTTDFPSSPSSLSSTSDGSLYIPFAHTTTTRNPHLPRVTELSSTQFYYGPISDKIGEACACWLARWGADIFAEEEKVVLDWLNDSNASLDSWLLVGDSEDGMEALPLSSDTTDATRFGLPTTSPWSAKWSQSNIKSIPRLFTATAVGAEHTGLSLSWIHALISSDDFFVPAPSLYASLSVTSSTSAQSPFDDSPNLIPPATLASPEEERYTFTKRVVELRRAVRTKVRRLRRKQMGVNEENEDWDIFSRHSQQRQAKGKERQLNPTHLKLSIDHKFPSDNPEVEFSDHLEAIGSNEWKQWSELWHNECREEDEQWDVFFRTSIYYANLSSEAVISISKDISPSTGRPYVKLRTLQEAAWEAGIMKSTITNNPPSLNIYPINKLGFAKTASDTLLALAADNSLDNAKPYFTIPFDESLRIGDTITTTSGMNVEGNIHNNITMDELFASSFGGSYLYRAGNAQERKGLQTMSGSSGGTHASGPLSNKQADERSEPEKIAPIAKTSNEQTFFGLRGNICYVNRTDDADTLSFVSSPPSFLVHSPSALKLPLSQLLSAYPPLRFSVEFFNLEMLKEKDRIHSRTVWYAGSLWNVYVQVVKRKEKDSLVNGPDSPGDTHKYRSPGSGLIPNYQLGVYLHRQSPTENIPPFSAPDPFADVRWSSGLHSDPSSPAYSPSSPTSPVTSTLQVPRFQQISSSSPSPSPRSPAFSPLTPYASAPQATSSSTTPSTTSRFRGNSAASPSSRPTTAPGSPLSPSPRPRTPGGSGGWRGLTSSNSSSSANSILSGNNLLSSSLPIVFPTFGRTRHQGSSSREGSARNIDNGIPSASVSNPYVGNSSPPSSVPTPSSIPAASQTTPSSTNASDPPFYAVINHKPTYSYCDPRQVVSVYFSINCASPSGSAQTRFRSAPDVFKLGQSWGWKSSGLLSGPQRDARNVSITDGNFEAALIQMDRESPPVGHEVSFRATVVLGVV